MRHILSRQHQMLFCKTFMCSLGLCLTLGLVPKQGQAQPIANPVSDGAPLSFVRSIEFKPKSDNPYPEKTETSGVRNGSLCAPALASSGKPSDSNLQAVASSEALKLTASARPTFWIKIPKTQAKEVLLSIEKIDKNNSSARTFHSQKRYPISQSPALVGLELADDAPDLDLEASYRWSVQLLCQAEPHPSNPSIFSSIRRVSSAVAPVEMEDLTIQHASQLSQDGFWYDPITILLEAHQANPNDLGIAANWQTLLKSANLEAIAENYGPQKSPIQFP